MGMDGEGGSKFKTPMEPKEGQDAGGPLTESRQQRPWGRKEEPYVGNREGRARYLEEMCNNLKKKRPTGNEQREKP